MAEQEQSGYISQPNTREAHALVLGHQGQEKILIRLQWRNTIGTDMPVCVCVCVRACVRACVRVYSFLSQVARSFNACH